MGGTEPHPSILESGLSKRKLLPMLVTLGLFRFRSFFRKLLALPSIAHARLMSPLSLGLLMQMDSHLADRLPVGFDGTVKLGNAIYPKALSALADNLLCSKRETILCWYGFLMRLSVDIGRLFAFPVASGGSCSSDHLPRAKRHQLDTQVSY